MRCLSCGQEIELGRRCLGVPFPDYGEDAYLFFHFKCGSELVGEEGVLDGYFVEGSEPVFVPREIVERLERAAQESS